MSHTISEKNIRWFNAHTEACGYLNGLKEITPKAGQDFKPFWVSTFCMLEGNPEKPRKTYISINIVNPKVVDILKPYANQLNADSSKVFVTARISDISVEPFVYGDNSKNAGQLGVSWQANLISLIALKVGDFSVDLKKDTTTDFGVNARQPAQSAAQGAPIIDGLFELPLVVNLDKSEPHFEETKARLKDTGYRWNSEKLAWCLASVALEKSDPDFDAKYAALKAAGYSFSASDKLWKLQTAPKQQGNYSKSQSNRQGAYQGRPQQAR
jgi:hypothetical protein